MRLSLLSHKAFVPSLCAVFIGASSAWAQIVVDSSADSGTGTLRAAIVEANTTPGSDEIVFDFDAEMTVIAPLSELPAIEPAVAGDATIITANLDVTLSGENLNGGEAGLQLFSDNVEVAGLIVVNFPGAGIEIDGDNNRVRACRIGTDGSTDLGNDAEGIVVLGGEGNVIGVQLGEFSNSNGNLIGGNGGDGIAVGALATSTKIAGNIIGLDTSGETVLRNGGNGILDEGDGTDIGGSLAAFRNVISGNMLSGVRLEGSIATGLLNNYIGLTVSGGDTRPNLIHGIHDNGVGTIIGGISSSAGNTIGGNNQVGIYVEGTDTTERRIQGNRIGTNPTGVLAFSNDIAGIRIVDGASNILIGGPVTGAGNVISGNDGMGIQVEGQNVTIEGNLIGVTSDGFTPLGNGDSGIRVTNSNVSIGGEALSQANVIANNGGTGVSIAEPATNVVVRKNSITENAFLGIDLAGAPNGGVTKPTILGQNPVSGTAPANATLDFYADSFNEGATYLGTLMADGSGNFSGVIDTSAHIGMNLTATATTADGTSEFSNFPTIVEGGGEGEGDGEGEVSQHTGDQNGDNVISLSELLRVIQFFNTGGLHCAASPEATEDGYVPGTNPAAQNCLPHASDYNPQNWVISLSELLRLIQFFNSGGYFPCDSGEDGFCPGASS